MLPEYKILIFQKNALNKWKKLSDLRRNKDIYYFTYNGFYYYTLNYELLNPIEFSGFISIYQFKDIEIKILKKRKITNISRISSSFLYYDYLIDYQIMLYLLSFSYNEKYLLISEKNFIELQKCSKYHYNFIYKNGNFITKIKIPLNKIYYRINNYFSFKYIFELAYLSNNNKFYGNKKKLSLLETICKTNTIEYEMNKNYIEIFIIIQQDLKYKEDVYFEGKVYSYDIHNNLLFIKVGKYALFI